MTPNAGAQAKTFVTVVSPSNEPVQVENGRVYYTGSPTEEPKLLLRISSAGLNPTDVLSGPIAVLNVDVTPSVSSEWLRSHRDAEA